MADDVARQVLPYIDEIAQRLWSNNAAVMVGAGYSQNAIPVGSTSASFPNWQELGDIFYEKLHLHRPDGQTRYLSQLKLAELVESAFGRPLLDRLLMSAIPNFEFEPSELHEQLLSLPWKDVLTTNYDTLLERACKHVTHYRYEVVTKTEDLLNASGPRIIKLHGSFPSPPFVITEEDYRQYPDNFAPFVNTVRQSLLENTLCLVGFSSDDPNFLQWIGWLRDHFGEDAAPKIYMVGVFNSLTDADRKLLGRRGIVVVDLSVFCQEPEDAFRWFFEELRKRRTRAPYWPSAPDVFPSGPKLEFNEVRSIVEMWRKQRREYPGWVIVPDDRRRVLWLYTERVVSYISNMSPEDRSKLEPPWDLDLAYELVWRLSHCLIPLFESLAKFLEEVLARYSDLNLSNQECEDFVDSSKFEAIFNVQLGLLRYYREQGLDDKWCNLHHEITNGSEPQLPEHKSRLRFEEVLHAFYRFDPIKAKRMLVDWPSSSNLPFWKAKRASLLAELGEIQSARTMLETCLSDIRRQLSLSPVAGNYTLLSQESVVMLLLWWVEQHVDTTSGDSKDLLVDLSERWNELARYKCDPRREIATLSARIRDSSAEYTPATQTYLFDLGYVKNTYHFGINKQFVAAYGLIKLFEDIGVPYRLGETSFVRDEVATALPHVMQSSPHLALVCNARVGRAETADSYFDREYLAQLTLQEVDEFFDVYLPMLDRVIKNTEADWSGARPNEFLAKTLPEVFSRLCCKCSVSNREKLLSLLNGLYGSKHLRMFAGVRSLVVRLLESMSIAERTRAIPTLLDLAAPRVQTPKEKLEFVNPLAFLELPISLDNSMIAQRVGRVEYLFSQLTGDGEESGWVATSLMWLHNQGVLTEDQSMRFGDWLWRASNPPEVHVVEGFSVLDCEKVPHPEETNPESRLKEHLSEAISGNLNSSRTENTLRDLRDSMRTINWSRVEIRGLLKHLIDWWDSNKSLLNNHTPLLFGSPDENIRRTIGSIVNSLSVIFARRKDIISERDVTELIQNFWIDLDKHDIPSLQLKVATLKNLDVRYLEISERIQKAMLDKEEDIVRDAIAASRFMATQLKEDESLGDFNAIAKSLVHGILWRHRPALVFRLDTVRELIRNRELCLTREMEEEVLMGLEQLAQETSTGVKGNDKDGLISIRCSAASLAFTLFRHYRETEQEVPRGVQTWKEICASGNEFSEVRNAWQ